MSECCQSEGNLNKRTDLSELQTMDNKGAVIPEGDPTHRPCKSAQETSSSRVSLQSCRCGPECGPEQCAKTKGTKSPTWENWQYKLFLSLIAAFIIWIIIYFSITLSMTDDDDDMDMTGMKTEHDHHHHHG